MSESLQYRLYNANIDPPVDAWPKIAGQLDQLAREQLSLKLQEATLDPPVHAWENIAATLDEINSPAVISITRNWRKLAIAAIAIGIILLAGILYFRPSNTKTETTASVNKDQDTAVTNNAPVTATQEDIASNDPVTQPAVIARSPVSANKPKRLLAFVGSGNTKVRYARMDEADISNDYSTDDVTIDESIIQYASMNAAARVAPRDYLTVAAPNGQPAKISAKFIDAVGFVFNNEPTETIDMALKSFSWKQRFRSWSNKLMSNAAFIPAATNFLDIVELEELLKE